MVQVELLNFLSPYLFIFFIAFLLNLKRFSKFLGAPLRECKCISSLEQNETNKEAATAEVKELCDCSDSGRLMQNTFHV